LTCFLKVVKMLDSREYVVFALIANISPSIQIWNQFRVVACFYIKSTAVINTLA